MLEEERGFSQVIGIELEEILERRNHVEVEVKGYLINTRLVKCDKKYYLFSENSDATRKQIELVAPWLG